MVTLPPEFQRRVRRAISISPDGTADHRRFLVAQVEDLTLKDVETGLATSLIKRCPNPDSTKPVAIELHLLRVAER